MKRTAIQQQEINGKIPKLNKVDSTEPDNQGEVNKKLVTDFMTNCWIANNYEDTVLAKYVSKDVKFDSPRHGHGWEGIRISKDALKDLELKNVIAGENNTVIVHAKCDYDGTKVVFIDIWRIDENGLLAECWNVIQKAPKDLE